MGLSLSNVLIIISVIFISTAFIIGLIGSSMTNGQCKELCNKEGAITYQRIADGYWFSIKDTCVCYGSEWIKTFTLNK